MDKNEVKPFTNLPWFDFSAADLRKADLRGSSLYDAVLPHFQTISSEDRPAKEKEKE